MVFTNCDGAENRVKEGGNPNAGVVPEMMLHKNLLPENFRADMKHSIGKVGMYHFDLSSTVTACKLILASKAHDRHMDVGLCRCSNCTVSRRSNSSIDRR
jgi:hypothetical protein